MFFCLRASLPACLPACVHTQESSSLAFLTVDVVILVFFFVSRMSVSQGGEGCCAASYRVWGRVQGVMFRQTLMRGAQRRGLDAGASNDADDRTAVTLTLCGDPQRVRELVSSLCSGRL